MSNFLVTKTSKGAALHAVDFSNAEFSAVEEQQRKLFELKAAVEKTTLELVASYSGILGVKDEFENCKKQDIEALRTYRHAVSIECKQIQSEITNISTSIKSIGAGNFKEFVELCERLNKLKQSGFFETVSILGDKK